MEPSSNNLHDKWNRVKQIYNIMLLFKKFQYVSVHKWRGDVRVNSNIQINKVTDVHDVLM